MSRIESNTFAEACFNQNSVADLEAALQGPADQSDCSEWGISTDEWRQQITLALAAKRDDA